MGKQGEGAPGMIFVCNYDIRDIDLRRFLSDQRSELPEIEFVQGPPGVRSYVLNACDDLPSTRKFPEGIGNRIGGLTFTDATSTVPHIKMRKGHSLPLEQSKKLNPGPMGSIHRIFRDNSNVHPVAFPRVPSARTHPAGSQGPGVHKRTRRTTFRAARYGRFPRGNPQSADRP